MIFGLIILSWILVFLVWSVLSAVVILGGCRVLKFPDARFRRALLVGVVLQLLAVSALLALKRIEHRIEAAEIAASEWMVQAPPAVSLDELYAMLLGLLVVFAVVHVLVVARLLKMPKGKAFALTISVLVVQGVSAVPGVTAYQNVYENFTIPTGSMVPALLGEHAKEICSHCGHQVAVSRSGNRSREGTASTRCPVCAGGISIPPDAEVHSGDKIAVEYVTSPRRWDLCVFRPPHEVETKYVDRLIGLPGEQMRIFSGDVFIDGKREAKPAVVQDDLWLPAYDSRFSLLRVKRDEGSEEPPRWELVSELGQWVEDGTKPLRLTPEGDQPARIRFAGRLDDFLSYNSMGPWIAPDDLTHPIGEVRLVCELEGFRAGQELGAKWRFLGQELDVSVSSTQATLTLNPAESIEWTGEASVTTDVSTSATSTLELRICDGVAALWCDGRPAGRLTVLPEEIETAESLAGDDVEACEFELTASGGALEFSRLRVWRELPIANLKELGLDEHSYSPPGVTYEPTDDVQLADDQYFFVGDNTQRSQDCRFFGPIRAADFYGVVRGIYWPPSRWRSFP